MDGQSSKEERGVRKSSNTKEPNTKYSFVSLSQMTQMPYFLRRIGKINNEGPKPKRKKTFFKEHLFKKSNAFLLQTIIPLFIYSTDHKLLPPTIIIIIYVTVSLYSIFLFGIVHIWTNFKLFFLQPKFVRKDI